jgi:Glycosyltransferase WbsX
MPSNTIDDQEVSTAAHSGSPAARLIAFYLPQFHPIPENDLWWGKGFTEWTNVAKARPLYRGHYQPRVPADLGFYDLRVPEVRAAQAEMARSAGIEGFCYWHYWFAGKRLLERPFNEVLRLKEPDFPFCLGWANQTWTGTWHGAPNRVLIEQTYPGRADYEKHFYAVLEAFHDPRYIRVRGKPLFVIFNPGDLPQKAEFTEFWQSLAERNGLPGIHFVSHVAYRKQPYDYLADGFAGGIAADTFGVYCLKAWQRSLAWYGARNGQSAPASPGLLNPLVLARTMYLEGKRPLYRFLSRPRVFEYSEAMLHFLTHVTSEPHSYPCILPNWDHSPRTGKRGIILHNSTPELFREHLRQALRLVVGRPFEDRLVFVKSWNEWAEGNYLEPDLRFGHQYLDVVREEVLLPAASEGCGHASERGRAR